MPATLNIFVLADTHDKLPAKIEALAVGADEIWHLGDICAPSILQTLETFGPPVTVVRGNCDSHFDWPLRLDLETESGYGWFTFRQTMRRKISTPFCTV